MRHLLLRIYSTNSTIFRSGETLSSWNSKGNPILKERKEKMEKEISEIKIGDWITWTEGNKSINDAHEEMVKKSLPGSYGE